MDNGDGTEYSRGRIVEMTLHRVEEGSDGAEDTRSRIVRMAQWTGEDGGNAI